MCRSSAWTGLPANAGGAFPEKAQAAALHWFSTTRTTWEDIRQIRVLIRQSREALATAVNDGDMTPAQEKAVLELLDVAESNLSLNSLPKAAKSLGGVCDMFD